MSETQTQPSAADYHARDNREPPEAETPHALTLPLDGPRGLLLPDQGPGRRQEHCRERRLLVAALLLEGVPSRLIAERLNVDRRTIYRDCRQFAYALRKSMERAGIDGISHP